MSAPFSSILLYEDVEARSRRFLPLTYTRSVAELRSGAMTAIERIRLTLPDVRIYLHVRPELKDLVAARYGLPVNTLPIGPTIALNARAAFAGGMDQGEIQTEFSSEFREAIESGAPVESRADGSLASSLWDLIHRNADAIVGDARWLESTENFIHPKESNYRGVLLAGEILMHQTAKLGLGVVLDASEGPIVIDEGARIMANASIIGPAYIGKNSVVKAAAKIYEGTTIGPVSKVGGEIEESIVQGYSNKQHDGFLGHSYLGEWCNLGADTNTSDLKNDYTNVRVSIEGEEIDTGSLFVGLLMGDHSKSAINTQFNTGTVVGVSCNVFSAGFPPKWIPNFSWSGPEGLVSYRFEKAIAVARTVEARRGINLTQQEEALLRRLFEQSNQLEV